MAITLKAILGFDGKAYEAGMKKAAATSKAAQKNITSSVKGAIGGVLTAGFITGKAKEIGEFARQVNDLAPALGMTTDELQEWEYVFARSGLALEDVSDAFATLADRTEDALSGTESMIEDFRLVGITTDQLRGKNPAQLFELFSDAVSGTSDKNRALTSIVRNLGDDLGRKLAPALMLGKKGLQEMRKEAQDLGIIMDADNIEEVANQMVEVQIASMQLRGLWSDITVIAGKGLTKMIDGFKLLHSLSPVSMFKAMKEGMTDLFDGDPVKAAKTMRDSYIGGIDKVITDAEKKAKAAEKMRNQKDSPTRSMSGINDEIEAKKAQAALQKKVSDAMMQQMSKEQQLNVLFQQRVALFEKIKKAKGKEKFELMSQDFDIFQKMQGLQTSGQGGRAMSKTASQNVGGFSRRVNPLVNINREQLSVARQALNVQQQLLMRSNNRTSPY